MLSIFLIVATILIILFAGVVLWGAPFLPTLSKRVDDALLLLDLQPGETMLELGSGDGRILKAAASRGWNAIGYELNPLLVLYSRMATWRYRKQVKIVWGNYWVADWPKAEGIYAFILQPYMSKLHKKVVQYSKKRKVKVVSFAFTIPDKKPEKEIKGMYRYKY